MIFTDYEVQVLETLKGNSRKNSSIMLRVPGGSMSFDDGTTTEVALPGFWKNPKFGKGYVFFTTKRQSAPSRLVGGPQGLFEISPWDESFYRVSLPELSAGRIIIPQVREVDELMKNYENKDAAAFLAEIKQLTGTKR
jgi:hypothetical protein